MTHELMNDFEITIIIILLVGAMGWIVFVPLEASPGLGTAVLAVWTILIGYLGGEIASKKKIKTKYGYSKPHRRIRES